MLPQLPCPNGSHQPNRSATADRNAAASDTRSAIRTTRIGSGVCTDEGATNRSVAQQLHLSPNTVKTHLRNAFAKLGITSRAQLAQLMRRSD